MTAREFQKQWRSDNPNNIHIPSMYEADIMEAYAVHKSAEDNKELVEALRAMYEVYPYGGKGDVYDREKACELAKMALKKYKP